MSTKSEFQTFKFEMEEFYEGKRDRWSDEAYERWIRAIGRMLEARYNLDRGAGYECLSGDEWANWYFWECYTPEAYFQQSYSHMERDDFASYESDNTGKRNLLWLVHHEGQLIRMSVSVIPIGF